MSNWKPVDYVYQIEESKLIIEFDLGEGSNPRSKPTDISLCQMVEEEPITKEALEKSGWIFIPVKYGEIDQSYWTTGYQEDKQVIVEFNEKYPPRVSVFVFREGNVSIEHCKTILQLNSLVWMATGVMF